MATEVAEKTILGLENPMGTDGFEFVEYTAPDIELLRSLFTKMGFPEVARHKSKNVTLHKQGDCNFIINAEPGSLRRGICQGPRPERLRHGLPGQGRQGGARPRVEAWRDGCAGEARRWRARHSGDRRHRRLAPLLRRSLWRERLDLRRRLRLPSRLATADVESGFEAHLHRPPHPQCESRADERLGRLLRAALQLPRDPLLRHRGQGRPAFSPRP